MDGPDGPAWRYCRALRTDASNNHACAFGIATLRATLRRISPKHAPPATFRRISPKHAPPAVSNFTSHTLFVLNICRSFLDGTSFHRRFPVPLPFTLVIHYRFFIGSMREPRKFCYTQPDRPCHGAPVYKSRHSYHAKALASLHNTQLLCRCFPNDIKGCHDSLSHRCTHLVWIKGQLCSRWNLGTTSSAAQS